MSLRQLLAAFFSGAVQQRILNGAGRLAGDNGYERLVMLAAGATQVDQVIWTPLADESK